MADMTSAPASATPAIAPKSVPNGQTTEAKPGASPDKDANPFKGTKHKTVIDGRPQEVDYDELVAGYQLKQASDKRFQEASAKQREWESIVGGLTSGDPKAWQLLKETVPKDVFRKVAFDFAYQEMEYDNLPPEKKREMELDDRQRKLEQEEQARKSEAELQQKRVEIQEAGDYLQKTLDEFVEKTGHRPTSEELYRMTEIMMASIHKHGRMPSIDELYKRISHRMDMDALSVLNKRSADVGEMVKWMPPELVKSLKKHFMEEATARHPRRHQPNTGTQEVARRREPKRLGIDESFKRLEQRVKGKR